MKELVSIILVAVMLFALTTCGSKLEQEMSGDVSMPAETSGFSEEVDTNSENSPGKKLPKPTKKMMSRAEPQNII